MQFFHQRFLNQRLYKTPEKNIALSAQILSRTVFNIDNNKKYYLSATSEFKNDF